MEVKTVGIACDHAGFPLKQFVLEYLEKKGYPVKDYGTYSDASVDYPDFGHALGEGIESGEAKNFDPDRHLAAMKSKRVNG